MAEAPLAPILRHLRGLAADARTAARSDGELLRAFLGQGDQDAFAALVGRHGPMVHGVCRRVLGSEPDAEDAFQASFLLLAQNAGSVRKQESLGSWLHGVAYRMARNVRRTAVRRRRHEARAEPPRSPEVGSELSWREVQSLLDEELGRLPEPYRAAFVLCCLENRPTAEAARELGVKEGTVWNRVSKARAVLRDRLAARGVALSALMGALAMAEGRAFAVVPPALAGSTARAAGLLAAHQAPADAVPASVVELLKGANQAMLLNKLKTALVLLVALGLTGAGLGLAAHQPVAATGEERRESPQPPPGKAAPPGAAGPAQEKGTSITLSGRVADSEGKAVAGAKVYLLDRLPLAPPAQPDAPKLRATSGTDGRFEFALAEKGVSPSYGLRDPWADVFLVAIADAFGPALVQLRDPAKARDLTLRLAKDDVPIRGRVLDLEGRPVAGATVRVDSLRTPNEGDLSAWLEELKGQTDGYPAENKFLTALYHPALGRLFPEVTTGKDGRFELTGVGRERVVGLTIAGPAIETLQVRVRTRPGETIQRLEWKDFPKGGSLTYYGADFDHTGRPTRPVAGVVRDKGTGKPVAGAVVMSEVLAGENLHGRNFIRTTTDRDGRYRLVGLPKGEGNLVTAVAPDDQPYLPATKPVADPPGTDDAAIDFDLYRGVWVNGRVTDKVTGKPVRGAVESFVFKDNPHLKDVPAGAAHHRLRTDSDGSFRFVGLPGRSLVAVRAHGDRYVTGVGAERYKERDAFGYLTVTSPPCHAKGYHTFTEIEAAAGADGVKCDVVLDPGLAPTGTVLGPDGKPLEGARMCGAESYASTYWSPDPLKGAEFTVYGMREGESRTVVFLHEGRKLAGTRVVRGNEKGPLTLKLEPWGTVTGRLVTADGRGRAGADLRFAFGPKGYDEPDRGSHPTRSFQTDKDGRFRIDGLAPGLQYHLVGMQKGVQYDIKSFSVQSGQTKDLGDVRADN